MGQHWNYLSPTPPTGLDPSVVQACYQFDGPTLGLTDRTGNGHDLTTQVAYGHAWVPMYEAFGCAALVIVNGNQWLKSAASAVLGAVGASTLEMVMMRYRMSGVDDPTNTYVAIGSAGETEAQNVCFCIYGSLTRNRLGFFHEYGAGSNASDVNPDYLSVGLPGQLCYIAATCDSDGKTYGLYVDGEYRNDTALSNAKTGATNVKALIGTATEAAGSSMQFVVQSARWSHAKMTAAQIEETYLGLHPGA